MMCRSKITAFTLVESMAAVALLAFIGVSVWLVMERCTAAAADTTQRMRAFEIAHENMEKLLGSDSVQESTDYGTSEKYPDIRWQTTIESFSEPSGSRMWVRAVCSAEYTDSEGIIKNIELTSWLTSLSDEQVSQMTARAELQKQMLAKHLLATEDLAAEYAGVTVETIQQWVKNGMPLSSDSEYLKPWLDLYLQTNGQPTEQDRQNTLTKYPELSFTKPAKMSSNQPAAGTQQSSAAAEQTSNDMGTEPSSEEIDPELQKQIDELMKEQP